MDDRIGELVRNHGSDPNTSMRPMIYSDSDLHLQMSQQLNGNLSKEGLRAYLRLYIKPDVYSLIASTTDLPTFKDKWDKLKDTYGGASGSNNHIQSMGDSLHKLH